MSPTGKTNSPFVDLASFESEFEGPNQETPVLSAVGRPFLSIYETDEWSAEADSEGEDHATFLNELYDEEFDETLSELANDAAALYEGRLSGRSSNQWSLSPSDERAIEKHFESAAQETDRMLGALEERWGDRDPATLVEAEIESLIDGWQPASELSPTFEDFFKKIGRFVKKVAKKAVNIAKKGIRFVGRFALGPILRKLKALIRPLLRRVLRFAIRKLPPTLQPIARRFGRKVGILKDAPDAEIEGEESPRVSEIQQEFNEQVASLLYASSDAEQDSEIARVVTDSQESGSDALAQLDAAREEFVAGIRNLKGDEDPTPQVENFLPAILPMLKLGLRLIGRKRVVRFLAKLLAKLIRKLVGPEFAQPLSRAIVDAGLRLIHLEVSAEDEGAAAGSAVAATVEETVRRVAALPDYVLDNEELLEGFALEAFEQAAAANLPPILPDAAYRKRPKLREARVLRGTWILMPLRNSRKRYKKYSQVIQAKLTPPKAGAVESFGGIPLAQFLEEDFGIPSGEDVEAELHLFESLPGTTLTDVVRLEGQTSSLGRSDLGTELHPLTPEAAESLLGEPDLGREAEPEFLASPLRTKVGQRFYRLVVPGMRPRPVGARQSIKKRHRTRLKVTLDFSTNQIRLKLCVSEPRSQELAAQLRQKAHIGTIMSRLRATINRGLKSALVRRLGRLKIVHPSVTPNQWASAFRRLPAHISTMLLGRLESWVIPKLAEYFKEHSQAFIAATEDLADGVTLFISIADPPGFPLLRDALAGKPSALGALNLSGSDPTVTVRVVPGCIHE